MSATRSLVVASNNAGKLREFRALLEPLAWELTTQADHGISAVEETGLTFVENALLKARAACLGSGLPALADDSGLAVTALGGAPGIYSARYSGAQGDDRANNEKLLEALADVPEGQRGAHYHCVLVYMRHAEDPVPIIVQGSWPGEILSLPRGEGGFGYDPLFWVPEQGLSVAELSSELKNRISHRGRALAALLEQMER
ncbi:RdgB/HAM1 family non-canonical purine NTP pyrophosphatase [Kushneria konosiri]|uniref:dITP/XTP pyrophosphatase n=1 Tax=Kushneria konosiri TaxID=698828 RepID=A0A2Z2H6C7_9GAMM|nr:RdgB/HAM1 family non-canonical purine NTP pyrophosphatase [Kushneria konosiri]ARS52416.1 non-canonical purine NTP pyrophosphatase, RdgB/HAM1 family [Kushneria konosiri]